jgi:diaminopimelate epimerase
VSAPPVPVAFAKMHGAGNDFVVVDRRDVPALADAAIGEDGVAAFVRAACDRRTGIGADGVLFLDPADPAGEGAPLDFRMRYYNRDGGRADLCGNGGRCLAAYAAARGLGSGGRLRFASDAGAHTARVAGGRVELVLGDVAAPRLGLELEAGGTTVRAGYAIVGVPHLVVESDDVRALDLAAFAPPLRSHPALGPDGANVDVAQLDPDGRVRLRTFERGVEGETLACGTGAAATAIVLAAAGRVASPVELEVAGGEWLTVTFERDENRFVEVTLAGPVATSFEGTYCWHWQPPDESPRPAS